jgi:hypothetical protein
MWQVNTIIGIPTTPSLVIWSAYCFYSNLPPLGYFMFVFFTVWHIACIWNFYVSYVGNTGITSQSRNNLVPPIIGWPNYQGGCGWDVDWQQLQNEKKIIMEIKVSTAMVNNSTNEKNTTSQLKSMNTKHGRNFYVSYVGNTGITSQTRNNLVPPIIGWPNYQGGCGWDSNNRVHLPHLCICHKPGLALPSQRIMS